MSLSIEYGPSDILDFHKHKLHLVMILALYQLILTESVICLRNIYSFKEIYLEIKEARCYCLSQVSKVKTKEPFNGPKKAFL